MVQDRCIGFRVLVRTGAGAYLGPKKSYVHRTYVWHKIVDIATTKRGCFICPKNEKVLKVKYPLNAKSCNVRGVGTLFEMIENPVERGVLVGPVTFGL